MDKIEFFNGVAEYKLLAKHEVGQNFLIDYDACERIVNCLQASSSDDVLEIGSGAGSLSYFLNEKGLNADLIDIDEGLVTKLQNEFHNGTVKPMVGNALKWDFSNYQYIIGNLPYYITTGIIERVLLESANLKRAVFMVQKEALARFLAKIGTEDYGPIHVLLAFRCSIKREFNVPRTSFSPAPHIDSSVFSLNIKNNDIDTAKKLYKLTCALFLNRRKTIHNNLTRYLNDSKRSEDVLNSVKIDPKTRPQNIDLEDYLRILHAISYGN
ncbi:MAG: 16S rRNA (adenine(1518)-N(6)/adenine(1519)-N(6))-dimethyltransferase RsmA [Bacilli bacterium]|nr:16S rRNA (adenine(1518)-N(6)/adenine(1519)-N(6))-dimethyltransferase RsmA [Bacilli bacterium]